MDLSGATEDEAFVSQLNHITIKNKILSGEYSIDVKRGRSKVWEIFGTVRNESGDQIDKIVACRTCFNIYKHNVKSTSNLVRHKCFTLTQNKEKNIKIIVDSETKATTTKILTQWTIQNCRPFQIVKDIGLHRLILHCIQLGARFGEDICIESLLPHQTTISNNIAELYNTHYQIVREQLKPIATTGFGLTSDLWTDNYLRKAYVAVTIHFILEGQLIRKLLGMISMEGEKCTSNYLLTIF